MLTLPAEWVILPFMTTSPAQRVAEEVRVAMTRRRISQATLAGQLGMSQAALSRRLQGEVPFDVDVLSRISELLDVPISVLMTTAPIGGQVPGSQGPGT
jgi:transcriptional regulator with XRE-family HTH domain